SYTNGRRFARETTCRRCPSSGPNTNLKTIPRNLPVLRSRDYTPVMKIAKFAIQLPKNTVSASLIALVVVSTVAGPVSAHHELATRLGMRLPATLKPVPVNAGPGSKPAVTEPESQPKTRPAESVSGKRKASENPDKVLILGGAEVFP